MLDPNFILLLVDNPPASGEFYAKLLGHDPVESSPTFSLFVLSSGVKLGFWSRHTVEPPANGQPGAVDLAFSIESNDELDRLYAQWTEMGLTFLQHPVDLDFGRTFLALDPDGHRLRVFFPNGS